MEECLPPRMVASEKWLATALVAWLITVFWLELRTRGASRAAAAGRPKVAVTAGVAALLIM
ncbi:hypothetical protein JUNP479_2774 [Aeromonas jandaei]|nr:hypothetical protein JUNP479_2774 [Aeromonas jandaei]